MLVSPKVLFAISPTVAKCALVLGRPNSHFGNRELEESEDSAAVEHDSDLIWFSQTIYVKVGKKPWFALFCTQLIIWNSTGVAVIKRLFHKG